MIETAISGGARIGLFNASWPLATLTTQRDKLVLSVVILGKYHFTPAEVTCIEPVQFFLGFSKGIRIHHNKTNYRKRIIFFPTRGRNAILDTLARNGFTVENIA